MRNDDTDDRLRSSGSQPQDPPPRPQNRPAAPPGGTTTGRTPPAQPPNPPTPGASTSGTASDSRGDYQAAIAARDATVIEEILLPTQLQLLLDGPQNGLGVEGFKLYLKRISAGIKDPIEKMLVEQFTVGHQRLMQLHLTASDSKANESVKVFNAAAARLQGELRRLALAIRLYRAPVSPKTFTVVEQQNVATQQEVNFHSLGPDHKKLHVRDNEVGSNPPEPSHDDTSRTASYEGPQPGANRLRESGALEGLHAGRA